MLNYFDAFFKVVRPKLYNSPYNNNIVQVHDVIKNYGIRCQLRFFFKLLYLRVENTLPKGFSDSILAAYQALPNKIFIPEYKNKRLESHLFNHELFHMAGYGSGNIMEGIVESLARLTDGVKEYDGYQLNVFVVEFINKIFNNDLYSIYLGNGKLYNYYKKKGILKQIKNIDKLITLYSKNEKQIMIFIKYLYAIKFATNFKINSTCTKAFEKLVQTFRNEKKNLYNLDFDKQEIKRIEKLLNNNRLYLQYVIPEYSECISLLKKDNDEFYECYEKLVTEYQERRYNLLKVVLIILTSIAKKEGYTDGEIFNIVLFLSEDMGFNFRRDINDANEDFFKSTLSYKPK